MLRRASVPAGMADGRVLVALILVATAATAREVHVPMPPDGRCPEHTVHVCETDLEQRYCTHRAVLCDGIKHCQHGEDENFERCLRKEVATSTMSRGAYGITRPTERRTDCHLDAYPPFCRCSFGTRVACNNSDLDQIPPDISTNVTHLYLQVNRITSLRGIQRYSNIKMLNLNQNRVTVIEGNVFTDQSTGFYKLLVRDNGLATLDERAFRGATNLTQLMLDGNLLTTFSSAHFRHMPNLHLLNLTSNRITLDRYEFPPCKLQKLYLDNNLIRHIANGTLRNLRKIVTMHLQNNQIETIDDHAFCGLIHLRELYMASNQLRVVRRHWFRDLRRLRVLHIGLNKLKQLPPDGFHDLSNLRSLDLTGITIDNISEDMWSPLQSLRNIKFEYFKYCAHLPTVASATSRTDGAIFCEPKTDGLSSAHYMLDTTVHKVMIWLIALMAVIGNVVVLWGRGFRRADDNRNVSVLICNLAVADLLMGVYLIIIAGKDIQFSGEYNQHALSWMRSSLCVLCGVLAMMSSEVAVLIMTYMSLDRFLAIVYPMVRQRVSSRHSSSVLVCMSVIWASGLIIALIPVFYWKTKSTFYGSNAICFPLHVQQPDMIGWPYSAFVFLSINITSLLLIVASYVAMFINIQRTRRNTPLVVREVEVAWRFFCIVATDCLCWTPIIVVKLIALAGVPIPAAVHAWIGVFVLPINSAVNPFLYTFTTTKFSGRIKAATAKYSFCVQHRRESVNVTRSESVGCAHRISLQVVPPAKVSLDLNSGSTIPPTEALLPSGVNVSDSQC